MRDVQAEVFDHFHQTVPSSMQFQTHKFRSRESRQIIASKFAYKDEITNSCGVIDHPPPRSSVAIDCIAERNNFLAFVNFAANIMELSQPKRKIHVDRMHFLSDYHDYIFPFIPSRRTM